MQYTLIKNTIGSILFDCRKGVENDARDLILKLCNTVESVQRAYRDKDTTRRQQKLSVKNNASN